MSNMECHGDRITNMRPSMNQIVKAIGNSVFDWIGQTLISKNSYDVPTGSRFSETRSFVERQKPNK